MNPRVKRLRAGATSPSVPSGFPFNARRWSDVAGWGAGGKPLPGAAVVITDNVILDEPVNLGPTGSVMFMGSGDPSTCGIYWDYGVSGGVSMTCGGFSGMGNPTYQCGTPANPFPANGSYKELNAAQLPGTAREGGYGFTDDGTSRGFTWDGPITVEAAGPARLWTQLSVSIASGVSYFPTVHDVSDWPVGARFAVAPSGYHDPVGGNETKIFTIASVTPSGITANETTAYRYWGDLQYPFDAADGTNGISLTSGLPFTRKAHANTATVIDERAEICLLSDGKTLEWRAPNDAEWNTQIAAASGNRPNYYKKHGFHAMFMRGSVQKIRGVVIRRGGQQGRLGRYPIHSHMASYKDVTQTVTIDTTNGNTIHWTAHGLLAGQSIVLTTTGKLLDGLQATDLADAEDRFYIVSSGLSADSFCVTKSTDRTADDPYPVGGAPLTASGTQSGVHTAKVTLFDHDLTGEYWDRLRIDESGNRFGSIHGTCGLTVTNCIGIDAPGQGWFFEDGSELRNVFTDNIGGKVRPPAPGYQLMGFDNADPLSYEQFGGPSGLWLTHPYNTIARNRLFDNTQSGIHNAYATLVNGASRLVRLATPSRLANPTLYQDNVMHSNGVNGATTPNGSGNRFGTFDRFHYQGEYSYGDIVRDFPLNMPLWERSFMYKNNGNGYNHSVPAPHVVGFVMCDNTSLDFIGGTNPSGILEQILLVSHTLNDIGGFSTNAYGYEFESDSSKHQGITSYHGSVVSRDNTFINYAWQAGHLHRQFDSGGGSMSARDCYLMGVFSQPQDWTGNSFINSHGGYLSESPYYTPEGASNGGIMYATTLSVSAASGASSVTLTSVTNCGPGASIGVGLDNGDTWFLVTDTIVGNVVTFKYGGTLPAAAAAGNYVRVTTQGLGYGGGPLRSYTIASAINNEAGIYGPTTEAAGGGRTYVLNRPFFVNGIGGTPNAPRLTQTGETGVLTDKRYCAIGGSAGNFYSQNADRVERFDPSSISTSLGFTFIESGYESYLFSGFHYVPFPDGSHVRVTHPGRRPQGSGTAGANAFYHLDVQSSDRPDADFSIELPWDAAAVPSPSQVFRMRYFQSDSHGDVASYAAQTPIPSARVLTALDLSTIPGGLSATKQQIVDALRSNTYNALADKYWVDVANNFIVLRHRGYNADGVTRNLAWVQNTLITEQDYRERNVAIWIVK